MPRSIVDQVPIAVPASLHAILLYVTPAKTYLRGIGFSTLCFVSEN